MSKKKKNNQKQEEPRSAKKAEILGDAPKKNLLPVKIIACLVVVIAVVAGYWFLHSSKNVVGASNEAGEVKEKAKVPSNEVSFPVSEFEDGQARYYSMRLSKDRAVKFFILKSSDGVIRAAFDACDVCWRAGLGYAQDGDVMVCRNCGRRFTSVRINEVKGGCNPAPLNRRIENGKVIITKADIANGISYFDFKS